MELRLVEIADRIDGRRHVAKLRAVAQQQFALVARAGHQLPRMLHSGRKARSFARGRTYWPGEAGRRRETGKIGVNLVGNRRVDRLNPQLIDDHLAVASSGLARCLVGYGHGQYILRPQRLAARGR